MGRTDPIPAPCPPSSQLLPWARWGCGTRMGSPRPRHNTGAWLCWKPAALQLLQGSNSLLGVSTSTSVVFFFFVWFLFIYFLFYEQEMPIFILLHGLNALQTTGNVKTFLQRSAGEQQPPIKCCSILILFFFLLWTWVLQTCTL